MEVIDGLGGRGGDGPRQGMGRRARETGNGKAGHGKEKVA